MAAELAPALKCSWNRGVVAVPRAEQLLDVLVLEQRAGGMPRLMRPMKGAGTTQAGVIGSVAMVTVFFAVHLWSRRLEGIDRRRQATVFSVAGGVSAAYVLVHLVPELHGHQAGVARALVVLPEDLAVYVVALAGLVVFFGIERLVIEAETGGEIERTEVPLPLFWTHIGVFALNSFVIGYLLIDELDRHPVEFMLFGAALALHFMVNDHALRRRHDKLHARHGRIVLGLAVVAGWLAGLGGLLPEAVSAIMFALLAGGIVFNVMKEELPPDGSGSFAAFASGAGAYALLLSLAAGLT